jgi:hypothetical protein
MCSPKLDSGFRRKLCLLRGNIIRAYPSGPTDPFTWALPPQRRTLLKREHEQLNGQYLPKHYIEESSNLSEDISVLDPTVIATWYPDSRTGCVSSRDCLSPPAYLREFKAAVNPSHSSWRPEAPQRASSAQPAERLADGADASASFSL